MGETETSSASSASTASTEELSGSKVAAFIGVLILCGESMTNFVIYSTAGLGGIFNLIYGLVSIILALVIFIMVAFIDLSPVKIPYLWWILAILGILLIVLAFFTTFQAPKPYLGGVVVALAGVAELVINVQKRDLVASKFIAFSGAAFAIYESIMIFLLYTAVITIVGAVFGIIFGVILIILVLDKIDIKIPYNWWVVLTIGFVIFTYVSPFYSGIGGTVIMIAFILIIIGF